MAIRGRRGGGTAPPPPAARDCEEKQLPTTIISLVYLSAAHRYYNPTPVGRDTNKNT